MVRYSGFKTNKMKEPKKIYVEHAILEEFDNLCSAIRVHNSDTEYISVNQLKEWITENSDNEENQAGVKMIVVDVDELLKFIEE